MSVFQGSRYVKSPAYVRSGEAVILSMRDRQHFDEEKATYHTVIQGETIDGIAYKKYGNAQLWWAIMDANPHFQSEVEIKPGDILMIPSFDEVVKASG